MVFISKKHLLSILAVVCMVQPICGMQTTLKKPSRFSSVTRVLNSTKTKVVAGVIFAAYILHRSIQWHARNYSFRPLAVAGYDPVIKNPKGIVSIFVHGFGGHGGEARYLPQHCFYQDPSVKLNERVHGFDFQDSSRLSSAQQLPSCMGQDADIQKLKEAYDALVAKGYKVNFYGLSRGGAALASFLALYQPNNVNSAIFESPFDDLESVVKNKLIGIKHIPLVGSMTSAAATAIATSLPVGIQNYSAYRINPIDGAHKIPHNIPLLFISSKEDSLIPYTSTQALTEAIRKAGHPECDDMAVDKGDHCQILYGAEGHRVIGRIQKFLYDYSEPRK